MGSTGTTRDRGMTDKAFFENEFPTMLGKHGRILACASKPAGGEWNRVFYAAVKNNDDATYRPGETWCLVVLMHNIRNRNAWPNFYYKEMSDESGPGEDTCPARILNLLTPTDHEYAIEWRERCRKNAEQAAATAKVVAKVKSGTVVDFAQPLKFTSGHEAKRFRVIKCGRTTYFEALDDNNRSRFTCRITSWRQRAFEVVA